MSHTLVPRSALLCASVLFAPACIAQLANNAQPASAAAVVDVARSGSAARSALETTLNTSVYSTLDRFSAASALKRVEDARTAGQGGAKAGSAPIAGRRDSVEDAASAQARAKARERSLSYLRAGGHAATLEALGKNR